LAKAALVASAKAVLTTIAAESTIILVVSIAISFLFSLPCSPQVRRPSNRHVRADSQIRRLFPWGVVASYRIDQRIVKRSQLERIFCDPQHINRSVFLWRTLG
jgi:hypothetical protein